MNSQTNQKNRVVVLVDMDCFYVQVVQRKNPSLYGKPCAVCQYKTWRGGGIIAVGYEARKFGVTRSMRGDDAKAKCPDIVLVHVPENRGKADLTQFREAGAEVIDVLSTFTDCLERASIDEAYLELTSAIDRELPNYTVEEVALSTFQSTNIVGFDNKENDHLKKSEDIILCDLYKQWLCCLKNNEETYRLAVGAVIADKMRKAVKEKTGFSCSAGIGQNKMLAKIVAGFHKPNQQTLVMQDQVEEMFKSTKMRKIRSLGGKLGQQLEDKFNAVFMSDLRRCSLKELQTEVGSKSGELVYWLCRGVDHEPVRVRSLPKSVGCSKNFAGMLKLKTKTDVHKWLTSLVEEVYERLESEKAQNNRVASLFTVGCINEHKISQSRRCAVVHNTLNEIRDEAYKSLSEFNKSTNGEEWSPAIINLNISAGKFIDLNVGVSRHIKSYMTAYSKANKDTHENKTKPVVETLNLERKNHVAKNPSINSNQPKPLVNFFNAVGQRGLNSVKPDEEKPSEFPLGEEPIGTSSRIIRAVDISEDDLGEDPVVSDNFKNFPNIENGGNSTVTASAIKKRLKPPESSSSTKRKGFFASFCSSKLDKFEGAELVEVPAEDSFLMAKKSNNSPNASTAEADLSKASENKENVEDISERHQKSRRNAKDLFSLFARHTSESENSGSNNLLISGKKNENKASSLSAFNNDEISRVPVDKENNRLAIDLVDDNDMNITSSKYSRNLDDLMNCEKCGKRILVWDLPDHLDFHYAKDVQDSLTNNFINLYGKKNNTPPKKKNDTPPKKKTKYGNNNMAKYFSPISKNPSTFS